MILMPLLVLGFYALQLDRSNISNALTDTLTTDLNITKDDVNLGDQLMMAGIIIAEIPSNIILQKLGAPIWLTGQVLIWGTVALTQAWVTNVHSFFATRFLLGFFEAGFIPGGQYMLALFYREKELALRTSVFYFGNYFATATGSLIAAGVLQMGGIAGLAGWQWLFISSSPLQSFVIDIANTKQLRASLLCWSSSSSSFFYPDHQFTRNLFTAVSTFLPLVSVKSCTTESIKKTSPRPKPTQRSHSEALSPPSPITVYGSTLF